MSSDLILLAGSPVKGDARCLSTLFHLQWTGTPVVDSRWPAWWTHTGFSKASQRAWMGRRGGSHNGSFLVSSTWRRAMADGRDGPKQELITSRWYLVTGVLLCVDEGEILWVQLYLMFSFFALLPPHKRIFLAVLKKWQDGKLRMAGGDQWSF